MFQICGPPCARQHVGIEYVNVVVAGDVFGGFGTVFEEVWSNYPHYPLCTKLSLHCHLRRVKMDLYHFFRCVTTSEPHVLAIYGPVKVQVCLIRLPKNGAKSVLKNTSKNHSQNFSRRSRSKGAKLLHTESFDAVSFM